MNNIDLTAGCPHPSGRHIYSSHRHCQWCKESKEMIELRKRREIMRWRKWPEEKPSMRGMYLVMTTGECSEWPIAALHCGAESDFWHVDGNYVTHWRPLGPLPEAK